MRIYHPSKFEVGREMHYRIIPDYALFIVFPTCVLAYFLGISITKSAYTDYFLLFWIVSLLITLFFSYRNFDIRRAFIIEADEQGVRLQYYIGYFFFVEKLTNVKLKWENIETIENWRRWSATQGALLAPVHNTLFIDTKNKEHYKIDINLCSTLMKKIDKELNEMLKQYGELKDEK